MKRFFVTGTGTGVGKTYFTAALAAAARATGRRVAALKPIETGCDPAPLDAEALAASSDYPGIAHFPGAYRASPPLAPWAATLSGEGPLDLTALTAAVKRQVERFEPAPDLLLVEGAGGIWVPLDAERTVADLIVALELPVLLVARDGLGVLSHVLTAVAAARLSGLELAGVVLARHGPTDPSRATNLTVLRERLDAPVWSFEREAEAILRELL